MVLILGVCDVHGLAQQFQVFMGLRGGKRVRLELLLIWHAQRGANDRQS